MITVDDGNAGDFEIACPCSDPQCLWRMGRFNADGFMSGAEPVKGLEAAKKPEAG